MNLNGLTSSAGLTFVPLAVGTLIKHYLERSIAPKIPTAAALEEVAQDGKQDEPTPKDNLRREELLYDQAFTIVKDFLSNSSRHTVEELQQFSNTRTPAPPWVRVVRVVVPMSCCNKAAERLITALGGETATKTIVGGTKWWQIRGVNGVDGEWILAKKDWREAKRRAKSRERRDKTKETKEREKSTQESHTDSASTDDAFDYTPDMDEQRCILYLHGGGYYFGSVDQERYSIQRFARKINGRVFAINYRLSPQYPFPCAIQDAVAAYLYLIEPPPEAKHKPVRPEHIVIIGDSAGGGLSLAALQVIRDSGLPQCAGGVLISPWCDLSHSFPSIHTNTKTDVIPYYGLSMHKPSILWPPPGDDESKQVRQTIRHRLRKVAGLGDQDRFTSLLRPMGHKHEPLTADQVADAGRQMELDPPASVPSPVDGQFQRVALETKDGESLIVDSQIQFYAPNTLLAHPLICHCRAYLGGLPPLFFIAGDQEVLRDEIIYTAHRAANSSKYSIPAESKRLYPKITEFAAKHPTPTKVHLQVYDGCAHVLPILFAFTTPAKYCFRAIASFCHFVTGMQYLGPGAPYPNGPASPLPRNFLGGTFFTAPPEEVPDISIDNRRRKTWWGGEKDSSMSRKASGSNKEKLCSDKEKSRNEPAGENKSKSTRQNPDEKEETVEAKVQVKNDEIKEEVTRGMAHCLGSGMVDKVVVGRGSLLVGEDKTGEDEQPKTGTTEGTRTGDATTKCLREAKSHRSLNSNKSSKDDAKSLKKPWTLMTAKRSPPERIQIPTNSNKFTEDVGGPRFERAKEPEAGRCAGDYPSIYGSGFEGTSFIRERVSIRGLIRPLEPEDKLPALQLKADLVGAICELSLSRYIEGKAKHDDKFSGTLKNIAKERARNLKLARKEGEKSMGHLESYLKKVTERPDCGPNPLDSPRIQEVTAGSWKLSWALDEDEHPPPSSIVSRRDTQEARRLAMIADLTPEHTISGNNLWQYLVSFLTATPDKKIKLPAEREHPRPEARVQSEVDSTPSKTDTQINVTTKAIALPQINGITPLLDPVDLGPTNTRPRGWLYWTKGSLWKEKFKVNNPSKGHKRVPSSALTTPVAGTPGLVLA